ncbi:hypothetical protein CYFUS_001389 [Cystobacter fuscus]|uniref:Lipoprotein n=1 Tax=Cystobacter fuscus TaxID=43 RepID=A0A250IW54_9BACT|nr:hypothetical protein [Cystobacter fuscus]ATB35975.1 hypothetical protein CYFUS_001389 [Cystobacter fuscus]
MRRSAVLCLGFSALLALAGCKNPCRQLSELYCDCLDEYQRADCVLEVANRERNVEPTDADLMACEQRLETCTIQADNRASCDILQTDEGKLACGLSR